MKHVIIWTLLSLATIGAAVAQSTLEWKLNVSGSDITIKSFQDGRTTCYVAHRNGNIAMSCVLYK